MLRIDNLKRRLIRIALKKGRLEPSDLKLMVTEFNYTYAHVCRTVQGLEADGLIIRGRVEVTKKGKAYLKGED